MEVLYRAIRASVSIFLCIIIANTFKLKDPFFVCIPATMLMITSYSVIKSGENRILGTVIGAIIGTLLIFLGPMNPITSGIGIIVIIFICKFIKWEASATIAGLIFMSIMIGVKGENPLIYSTNRTFDTLIGIIITIIVNNLMPYIGILAMFRKRCNILKSNCLNIIKDILTGDKGINLEEFAQELEKLNYQVDDYKLQKFIRKNHKDKIKEVAEVLKILTFIFEHLKIISVMDVYKINNTNCIMFNTIFKCKREFIEHKENEDTIVLNYHLKKILSSVNQLNFK